MGMRIGVGMLTGLFIGVGMLTAVLIGIGMSTGNANWNVNCSVNWSRSNQHSN